MGIFKQAWLLSLLGIILISVLIYFLGPLLAIGEVRPLESELNRYATIGAMLLLWGLWQLWRVFRARKKNQQMVDQLVKSADSQASPEALASREEMDELTERLQDALHSLEKTRRADGKADGQYLYQLPWYIIIGPPGAGKTTLLANSSLHFPLSEKYGRDAMRGVGGTRNCDWWFTDNAILLDTAGRYTTQDSQQVVDQTAWQGFLDLLKQYRGHQPINGVMVAVSLADFLQQDAATREQHAKAIRKRIQELHEQLGIRFPVYMLFTKTDLVAGFADFFDDLDKEGREQVWGMTFPFDDKPDQSAVSQFEAEFALLETRVHQQLIEKLERERSPERCRALYLFPQQFSFLKENLAAFLDQLYRPSRYEQTAMLRGIYFTSATQEGAPIDRIMASLASNFGISPQRVNRFSAQGRSFFINHLLDKVVFTEAGLAGTNLQLTRKLQWMQSVAAMGAVVLVLAAGTLWATSFFKNRDYIAKYTHQVEVVEPKVVALQPASSLVEYLSVLGEVRQLTWSYADGGVVAVFNEKTSVPLFSRFGLAQAKTLGEAMDAKYVDLLKRGLAPYAKQLLENQIRNSMNDPAKAEVLFNALKNYLFLGGQAPKGLPVSGVTAIDWDNNGQVGDKDDREIGLHMQVVLQETRDPAIDAPLVTSARTALRGVQLEKLAYYQFKQEGIQNAHPYDFLIQEKKDLQDINLTFKKQKPWTDNVPGFFTKKGYEEVFLPNYLAAAGRLSSESWVLGGGQEQGRLMDTQQMANLFMGYYQDDYIKAWNNFLAEIEPHPVRDRDSAKQSFKGLTSNGGNVLLRLMQEVSNETDFSPSSEKQGLLDFVSKKPVEPLVKVDMEFQGIQDWTDATKFQSVGKLLDEIYGTLNQESAWGQVENNALTNALGTLGGEIQKLPPPIGNIMRKLVQDTRVLVVGEVKKEAVEQFQASLKTVVGDFCQQNVQGHYPLVNSKEGVTLAAFTELFQLNGKLDQFRTQYLQTPKVESDVLSKVSVPFEPAETERRAFFPYGHLNISFSLRLLSMEPTLQSIELSIGAQNQVFKLGDAKTYTWPGGPGIKAVATLASLPPMPVVTEVLPDGNLLPTSPPPVSAAPQESPPLMELVNVQGDEWQLFRMVTNNKLLIPQAEFQVIPASQPDPFQVANNELRKFKCPAL